MAMMLDHPENEH